MEGKSLMQHPKYRADIDGLRAIAVLSVVAYHAFPQGFKGCFIGVDIFFVISGFLISTIIFRSIVSGNFSFKEFYARRIKRIFPALVLVLTTSWVIGWFILFSYEYKQLGKYIAAGSGFTSNFLSWNEAGYFDTTASNKPMLHLWSLAIEAQFYFIWPLIIWLFGKNQRRFITIAILITIVSFSVNIFTVNSNITAAFYSPLSRAYELMMGSVLAYLMLYMPRVVSKGHNLQSLLGLGLIAFGLLLINDKSAFPGWWALLPTLGAFFIISAGPLAWFNRYILSSKLFVWFGLISYPLYLWHWPLLSYINIVELGKSTRLTRLIVVLISILLAWLTYRFLERPIHFGKLRKILIPASCTSMVALGFLGFYTVSNDGFPFRMRTIEKQFEAFELKEGHGQQKACTAKFPLQDQCLETNTDLPHDAVLIGDSHAYHYYLAVNEYFKKVGKNIVLMGAAGCVPFYNLESGQKGNKDYCMKKINSALDYAINTPSVKTVLLASRGALYMHGKGFGMPEASYNRYLRLTNNPEVTKYDDMYAQAMKNTLDKLIQAGKKVIFLVEIPELGFEPFECISRVFYKDSPLKTSCALKKQEYDKRKNHYYKIISSVLKEYPSVYVFYPNKYFCDDKYCWGMKDGIVLYRNNNHLSLDGASFLGKHFEKEVKEKGLNF